MKVNTVFALFLGLLLFSTSSFKSAPVDEKEYILCIVHGEYTQAQGLEMATAFKTQYPAVSICRLDNVSRKFFVIYETGKVSRDNVIDFFNEKKLKATCLHKGIYGKDPMPDITAAECK